MPMFHCSDSGRTWLGTYPLVPLRACACVKAAVEAFGGIPPLARNPCWLRPGTSTVVVSCGGRVSRPKLSTRTSKLRPKPARMDVFPLVPGEYAKPTRGIQAVFIALGFWNTSTPGTLDMALIVWRVSLYGTV